MVIELGLIYALGKDILSYTKKDMNPVPREVNGEYIKDSGLQSKWEEKGYELGGVTPENIESCKLKGWEILYEFDNEKDKVFYLQLKYGTVYMGRKKEEKKRPMLPYK